jgi:hypothetical protein
MKPTSVFIDLETEQPWTLVQRTRGADVDNGATKAPTPTWIMILTNPKGERRFVPEKRVLEWYRRPTA